MSALNIIRKTGPAGYIAEEAVTGGQVVAPGTAGGVVVAAADAAVVLGVALVDAAPTDLEVGDITVARPRMTSVAYGPAEVKLAYTGALAHGDKVGVDVGGAVKKHVAGAVVGTVSQPPADGFAVVRLA